MALIQYNQGPAERKLGPTDSVPAGKMSCSMRAEVSGMLLQTKKQPALPGKHQKLTERRGLSSASQSSEGTHPALPVNSDFHLRNLRMLVFCHPKPPSLWPSEADIVIFQETAKIAPCQAYWCGWPVITKHHRPGTLNLRISLSPSSGEVQDQRTQAIYWTKQVKPFPRSDAWGLMCTVGRVNSKDPGSLSAAASCEQAWIHSALGSFWAWHSSSGLRSLRWPADITPG